MLDGCKARDIGSSILPRLRFSSSYIRLNFALSTFAESSCFWRRLLAISISKCFFSSSAFLLAKAALLALYYSLFASRVATLAPTALFRPSFFEFCAISFSCEVMCSSYWLSFDALTCLMKRSIRSSKFILSSYSASSLSSSKSILTLVFYRMSWTSLRSLPTNSWCKRSNSCSFYRSSYCLWLLISSISLTSDSTWLLSASISSCCSLSCKFESSTS